MRKTQLQKLIEMREELDAAIAEAGGEPTPAPEPEREPTPKKDFLRPTPEQVASLSDTARQYLWAAYTADERDRSAEGGKNMRALNPAKVLGDIEPKARDPHKVPAKLANMSVTMSRTEMTFGELIEGVLACKVRVPKAAKA